MATDIPFDVMMKGPAAVAAWLAGAAEKERAGIKKWNEHQLAIMRATKLDPNEPDAEITANNMAMALGACLQVAVLIAYAGKDGSRAKARDAIAEIIDDCFDIIEDDNTGSAGFRDAIAALRAKR